MRLTLDLPDLGLTPSPPGRRERRRARSAKRRRLAALAIAPIFVMVGIVALTRLGGDEPGAGDRPLLPGGDPQITTLVMTTLHSDVSGQADTIALFATDPAGRKAFVLLVPTAVLTEIPGFGFDTIGRALSFGRTPLAEVTIENMLGVSVDHTAVLEDSTLARLIDRLGGIRIKVPATLLREDRDGRLVPAFDSGDQPMNGKRATEYLAFKGPDETELSRLARAQQVWEAIFVRSNGAKAKDLRRQVALLGSAVGGDASAEDLGRVLAVIAGAPPQARGYDVVPVGPVGSAGGEEALRLNQEELEALVGRQLLGSLTAPPEEVRARVQLLNGNGIPEAGVLVAQRLVPAGFRIVDTGNAVSFNFPKTKIIVYADEPAIRELAERIRMLLKVGEIEIGRRPQTAVDITVVIGKDLQPE